ncbi:MAG: hypothetical protein MI923_06215 [Phycisphaerales bacterium]|nr:hypothetical protein [Phycisphaerales bacterium]
MFRFRWIKLCFGAFALVAAAVFTTDHFGAFEVRRLRSQINELEREKAEMALYVERLSDSRRVAQVDVVEQYQSDTGEPITLLRWQQIGPSGTLGVPENIEVKGAQVYFEAKVIKFKHSLIAQAAPDKDWSLFVFRRVFGEHQSPSTGYPLDRKAPIDVAGESEPDSTHARLWDRFLQLMENPVLASEYGVRTAQYEAASGVMRPGQIWEVSLDAAGGLNLRMIGVQSRPAANNERNLQISARQ